MLNLRPIESYDEEPKAKEQPLQRIQQQPKLQIKKNFQKDMIVQSFDDSFEENEHHEMTKENLNANQGRFVINSTIKVGGEDVITVIKSAKPHFSYIHDM
jgi:hypothetical protein